MGLITSDGNIGRTGTIRIDLTESDKYILEEIQSRLLNGSGNLSVDMQKNANPVARLSFCGKKICQNLAQYGVIPNKSDFLSKVKPYLKFFLNLLSSLFISASISETKASRGSVI